MIEWLEHPSRETWDSRRQWFEDLMNETAGKASYIVSEQACALVGEVQMAFCAGAFLAAVVLAMSVVDAQFRQTEMPGYKGSTKGLIEKVRADPELQKLRKRRNSIVHVDKQNPVITVDQQWDDRFELEKEARNAIRLMFEAFHFGPWI